MRAVRLLLPIMFVGVGCTIDHALVGGACADGFEQEERTCVPIGADASSPSPRTPAGAPISDGSAPDGAPREAGGPGDGGDAGAGDGSAGDGGSLDGSANDGAASDAGPTCAPPLVACRGACIAVANDPANCGACGKVCPSNICTAGTCQGQTPGDVVLIGHDYASASAASPYVKVLVNAVALATTDPIRILSYEELAASSEIASTRALLAGGIRGRNLAFTPASAADLESSDLARDYDVVLLYDGSGSTPAALGGRWATSLDRFARRGGVVVALDGAASRMHELVTSAGLLAVPSHASLPDGAHLVVSAPGDAIGAQVLSPYATLGAAVGFVGVTAEGPDVRWVVRESGPAGLLGAPVVVHRVVR